MRIYDTYGKSLSELLSQATYVHHQTASAAVWTISHNLGKYPSIQVVESTGVKIYGSERFIDANTVEITFNVAITGKVYLN